MTSILKVSEIQDPTNSNTVLTIDSSGLISNPNLPHFFVHKNAAQTAATNGEICVWQNVIRNNGNHWDATNHRFVAPISGVYMFCLNWLSQNASNLTDASIFVDGNGVAHSRQPNLTTVTSVNHNTNNLVIAYYLSAGSYADVRIGTFSNNAPMYGDSNYWTTFSGFLIG